MANGRCRFHGGKSTGPTTADGFERARQAALRHGFYTAEAKAERRMARAALVGLRAALTNIDASRRTAFHEAGHVVVSWAIPDELIRPLDVMTARNG